MSKEDTTNNFLHFAILIVQEETVFSESLEDHQSVRIVLYLHQNGTSIRSVVYAFASNSPAAAKSRIDKMIIKGLISEKEEQFPPKRKWLELTKKGERVAEHLLAIQRILSE